MSSEQAVVEAVRQAGLGTAASVSRLPVGMSNAVYDVALNDGARVVARVASIAKNRYAMENLVMDRVRGEGVPCPEVYAIEEVGDLAVMLIEHLPGVRLAETPDASRFAGSCGEILACIHSIAMDGFGSVMQSGQGEGESLERWFIDDFEPSILRAAQAGDEVTRRAVEAIHSDFESARPLLRNATSALVHGDYSPSNILVHDSQVSGVIDWESAKAGPPAFDFGWWDWFEAAFAVPFSCDDLVLAYASHRQIDVDETRELRRLVVKRILIGQVAWAASRQQKPELEIALRRLL